MLAALVLGGIYTGIFTPTEGGAIGAMGAFILLAALKKMNRKTLDESFMDTARTTALIFIIVTGALFLASFMALTGIPTQISNFIVSQPVPSVVTVILTMFLFLALGCVLDPISMMVLTLPILMPALRDLGVDAIWYGILVTKMAAIGMITPPIGLNCFMLKGILPELSLRDIFSGCGWFLIAEVVAMGLLIAFPQITTFLPNQMFQ